MSLWGEIAEHSKHRSEDWTLTHSDMEDLLNPQMPQPTVLNLHQPSQEETPSFQILPPEFCRTDPLALQTVRLLQYQRQSLQLINRLLVTGNEGGNLTCPPPPDDLPGPQQVPKHHFLNFIPPSSVHVTMEKNANKMLEVEGTTARLVLRKAVGTICAHTGYTDSTESVLHVLTDIAHEFISKMSCVLRAAADNFLQNDSCPFHDIFEQTLHDVGIGSMSELHHMYQKQVLEYYCRMKQDSADVHQQFILLSTGRELHTGQPVTLTRRESSNDVWTDETTHMLAGANCASNTQEEMSVASIRSFGSIETDMSAYPFSVLSQDATEN